MGIFSAIFTSQNARVTTIVIRIFTPIFYRIETKNGGYTSDTVINDSYFIGYMMGVITYVFDINNIKDEFDQKLVLLSVFDHFFG